MVLSTTETCCWLCMCKNIFYKNAFFGFLFIHCAVYNTLTLVSILNHMNALYTPSSYSVVDFIYYLTSTPRSSMFSLYFNFSPKSSTNLSHLLIMSHSGFDGLVSMLASGTQDRGFEPDRSPRMFRTKKSTACLPSEGK
jgi:hypothetical protein